jgi:hypothetical protein
LQPQRKVNGHETAHYHQAPPCKKRPPGPIKAYIYLSEGYMLLLSFLSAFAALRLLGLHGEEPHASEYALLALFAFTLPLLFT